jgi:glucokinase
MDNPRTIIQQRLASKSRGFLGGQGCILGMDVGSYGLRAALIDLTNQQYDSLHLDAEPGTPERTVEEVIRLCHHLLERHQVQPSHLVRVGVGFGGPVDARRGMVIVSPRQAGWEQYPLKQRVEEALGAVTLVDNDANLIALAEASFGVAADTNHLFYLHLSSGVGGGLVLNGRLYHGATTTAGEIGHAVVGLTDPVRPRQISGTLEQHVSIKGLLRRASELGLDTTMLSDIFSDNPIGQQVVAEAVEILAMRLSQIVALIDPQMIVIGGVVARTGGEAFISAVGERMRFYMASLVERQVPVTASILGFESVAIGGLALALESIEE